MKRQKKDNIILIGFMGSGKTSIGIRLSYKLQLVVEDTDKIIEEREGMPISEIFKAKGEGYFRNLETGLLREIRDSDGRKIYSLGGGTPVQLQNQSLICQCGKVIYLRAKPETLYARLKNDTTRPLLRCDDPQERIRVLLSQRTGVYERCADFIVDVDDKEQGEVLESILEYLEQKTISEEKK
ncbi:MAG: shikimate kinase [Lachnospiraceae bacterium]|nr:shikimate kinase [Lachnospiraceae bacterium]